MADILRKDSSQNGPEPPMYLQRPSSARSQDVSHILASTFRDLFMKETIGSDTVQYLTLSKGSDDDYHERYVAALEKVQIQRDNRMAEAAMLERRIMQAQALVLTEDERALSRGSTRSNQMRIFPDLGLPQAPSVPQYTRETESSRKKYEHDDRPPRSSLPREDDIELEGMLSLENKTSSKELLLPIRTKGVNKSKVKDLWRDQMDPEERDQCRNGVENLNAKVRFLKNPRHLPPTGPRAMLLVNSQKTPKETGVKCNLDESRVDVLEDLDIFIPNPAEVVFTEYKIGKVYELTLQLKNVSAVLRPVRVIPPKTIHFAVGLGQFPGQYGLVAAGMSCYYTIRFSPDSYVDFDDMILVQTQSSKVLKVPLKGRRPPPVLSLPETLNVGECLIGGTKTVRVTINNSGGKGRFCLVPRTSWPVTNFKMSVTSASINIQPFEIYPTTLEIDHGESALFQVTFSPFLEGFYEEKFTIICDNCQTRYFTVVGQGKTASVEILSVEGGLAEAQPGELCDETAQHLVRFETLNPYTYYQKNILVKNCVNIDLEYQWLVIKPVIKLTSETENSSTSVEVCDQEIDNNSPFSISPPKGILSASGMVEFQFTFAPPMVAKYHSVMHMILKGIPQVLKDSELSHESMDCNESDMSLSARPFDLTVRLQDTLVLGIDVKGECTPFSAILQPHALYIPGQLLINTQAKKTVRMINASMSSIVFEWERYCDGYVIQVEPPMGELDAQSEYEFEITVSSAVPCKISHTLNCHVQHTEQPLTLYIEAIVKGPEVYMVETDIDFDLLQLGSGVMRQLNIHNKSEVSAQWSIQESLDHAELDKDSDFSFSPSQGLLNPLDSVTVDVYYKPKKCVSLQTMFIINVEDGEGCAVNVRGEVQCPVACLKSCVLSLPEVYLNVPVRQCVTLINQTMLPTTFSWQPAEGQQSNDVEIKVNPSEGHLGAREELELEVEFQSHILGKITQLNLPCEIGGTTELLHLAVYCDVLGPFVAISVPDSSSETLAVEFGNVKLNEVRSKTILLENRTGIAAPYQLVVENYFTKPPSPPSDRSHPLHSNRNIMRRSILGRSPNPTDPTMNGSNRAMADIAKAMLQLNRGVAFTLSPDKGVLEPFGKQTVNIQAFSDMWGCYEDKLIARIEGVETIQVPMNINVIGCPLNFQMVAANPEQKPVVRFGTHVSGVPPICRQMRINNSSPVDVTINWQVFTLDESDEQLLDLITSFGNPFPLCDEEGNEILPEGDDTSGEPESDRSEAPVVSENITSLSPFKTEDRPNIISLFVREHGGKQQTSPFRIEPSRVTIPSHSYGFINVIFTPLYNELVNNAGACNGFALGYLSLSDKDSETPEQAHRKHGYFIEPMRLDIDAFVKPALLTVECGEEEGVLFRVAASDLVSDLVEIDEKIYKSSVTLLNDTQTVMNFRLLTTKPFCLVSLDPATKNPSVKLQETENTSLKPQQNALIQVAFCMGEDVVKLPEALEGGTEIENVTLEANGTDRKLIFKQNLTIEFSNGSTQILPLEAQVTLPGFTLSKDSLDFGVCYVGQPKEMQVQLTNPTLSNSYWTVLFESRSESSTDSVFDVSPSNGKLDAFITHASNKKAIVTIKFTAKHNEIYDAVLVFNGMLGETPVRFNIHGEGSYDEKHEMPFHT